MVWKIYDLVSTITRILLASFPAWVIRPTLNPMTMEKLSGFAFNVAMPVICRYSCFLTTTTLAESIRLLPGVPDDDHRSSIAVIVSTTYSRFRRPNKDSSARSGRRSYKVISPSEATTIFLAMPGPGRLTPRLILRI